MTKGVFKWIKEDAESSEWNLVAVVAHTKPLQSGDGYGGIKHTRPEPESLPHIREDEFSFNFALYGNLKHRLWDIHTNPLDAALCQYMSWDATATPYVQHERILSINEI